MGYCYIESELGGIICSFKDSKYFLNAEDSATLCYQGTKEEVENYLGVKITDENTSYAR